MVFQRPYQIRVMNGAMGSLGKVMGSCLSKLPVGAAGHVVAADLPLNFRV
ncbi:MAG: hypothetical protein WBL07_10895 [Thiothrix litoralis]